MYDVNSSFDLAQFWQQGDAVSHVVAVVLVLLSLSSWTIIFARLVGQFRLQRGLFANLDGFWTAADLDTAVRGLQAEDRSGLFAGLAEVAVRAARFHSQHQEKGIGAGVSSSEFLTRAMRNYMVLAQAGQEKGLTFLASVGATAPFIGLFGTVWGIYHALVGLSGATQVVLDKVAGPVGEALIMTAAGLFVAIPAVLAYNAANRANRVVHACLDGFAHDLHAFLTTGARMIPTR